MEQAVAHPASASDDFFVGDWLVQPSLGVVSRRPASAHLEPKTMQVLVSLASHPGMVVSKDDLLHAVWPDTFVTEHVLTQAIWQLRQAFGASGIIQTIPRRGYRLVEPVKSATPAPQPSVAVLPLANLSGDSEQEYFVEGMTEALISALAQIGALRVISRTSIMQYSRTKKSVPQIAAELNANYLVEGSVLRDGERVRISVQLIRAATDQHIWAKNYDRDVRDVLAMQDEVARAIAREIEVTLTPEEHSRLGRSRPVHPDVQELYLKGQFCQLRTTEDSLRLSIEYFQQAIALDPGYALAHVALARSVAWLSIDIVAAMPPIEAEKIVRPAVMRALELDPLLPEAHHMLGWTRLVCDWDWAGAEEAYRRALELKPNFPTGWVSLCWIHLICNRPEAAVEAFRRASELDPLSMLVQSQYGFILAQAGRMLEALEQLQKTIRLEPNYFLPHDILGGLLSHIGRHDEAIAEAEKAFRICGDPVPKSYLGYVYARAGRLGEARQILSELQDLSKTRYVAPMMTAAILTALGEADASLDYLERAQQLHDSSIPFIRSLPQWRPLHGHARFEEIVRRMNFPE